MYREVITYLIYNSLKYFNKPITETKAHIPSNTINGIYLSKTEAKQANIEPIKLKKHQQNLTNPLNS